MKWNSLYFESKEITSGTIIKNYCSAFKQVADFNVFSKQFGLPLETSTNALAATNKVFQVVNAKGVQPP